MRTRTTTALLATIVSVTLTSAAAAHADGGSSGSGGSGGNHKVTNATFGAAPANAKKPDGRPHFVFDTTPGGQIVDHLAVLNISYKPEQLSIYTVDATSATNGTMSFRKHDEPRRDAGAWMAVGTPNGKESITVPARATMILPLHVDIPRNASPGDHIGAVVVSLTGKVVGTFGNGTAGQKVDFEQRIAVQAQFRVIGPLHPRLVVAGLSASYDGPLSPVSTGRTRIHYVVRNEGNVVLGGPQTITVHGLLGSTETLHPAPIPGLLPGAEFPVTVTVPGVYPELLMSAKVAIDEQGLTGQITPGLGRISASAHFWAIPWILLAIVLFVVLSIWLAIRRRRKRRKHTAVVAGPGRHRKDVVGASA